MNGHYRRERETLSGKMICMGQSSLATRWLTRDLGNRENKLTDVTKKYTINKGTHIQMIIMYSLLYGRLA
jgi:hypothetical protein